MFCAEADVRDYVVSNDIDSVLLTENWLTSSDADERAELTPDGYHQKDIRDRPAELVVGFVVLSSVIISFCQLGNSIPLFMVIMSYCVM